MSRQYQCFCLHCYLFQTHQGVTKCQLERAKASKLGSNSLQPVGRFIPQCAEDGTYSQIQCWASTGYCWCVDAEGREVAATRMRGKPSCSSGRSGVYYCNLVHFSYISVCFVRSQFAVV